ncbi:3beta-hydroxysteroid-dehydrogenase/ decarboxylase isoform 2 [Actinidia rufa]|uniref:3beta-hydroxysteroid-dehydrogenase/ decarboxylase isoform 2 n=1 Tax=Actinidia rufa TaxID=165716 RepID=A0A7J0FHR7_9ERIC|nr:3beta-hydroxysteroid-dehydrogenase/ decarboxylase isoform 2 [Actinidia rufa]
MFQGVCVVLSNLGWFFSLLILSFLGAISLQNLFIIGLPIAFVAFVVYEKKEEEIDRLVSEVFSFACKSKSEKVSVIEASATGYLLVSPSRGATFAMKTLWK